MADRCCAVAEAYGAMLYCNTFTASEVRLVTESQAFAERLPLLMRKAFGIAFDRMPEAAGAGGKQIFSITDPEKLGKILSAYGYDEAVLAHRINLGILERPCCRTAFIRGAFLAGGSVTDPEKRYHLELVTGHFNVSRGTYAMLLDMQFQPKDTVRKGNYVTYFKQSGAIEDFLTTVGAPVAAMDVMNAKVEKDIRNAVQRRVNCDTANVEKAVEAAQEQLAAIRRIEQSVGLDSLPEKLHEAALLRIVSPEASLSELAQLADPPVSKSCISHRLKKLTDMAKRQGGPR